MTRTYHRSRTVGALLPVTTVVFLLFCFGYPSCTKLDTGAGRLQYDDAAVMQKFLAIPVNAPTALARVSKELTVRDGKEAFIVRFARQNGFPVWNKVKLQFPAPRFTRVDSIVYNAAAGDTVVIIPFVLQDSNTVSGFITAKLNGTVQLNWYRASDYNLYSFNNVQPDSISADKAALQLMVLNNYVFGYTRFLVQDNRLFSNSSSATAPTAHNARIFTLTDSIGLINRSAILMCTTCTYWVCSICHGLDPNCPLGGSGLNCYEHFCVGGFPPGGGGVYVPPTGGGGGGASEFPCASRQQSRVPPPGACTPGQTPGPVIPLPEEPAEDPCVTAQNAAKRMDTLFTQSKADSVLGTIPNLATEPNEKGFFILAKYSVSPTNPANTTITGYKSGSVQTGTDTSITIPTTIPYLHWLVSWLHTHPPKGYSAHSPSDVYKLIEERLANNHCVGSFVAGADGGQYALTVTDVTAAFAFESTKSQNLDGRDWKKASLIRQTYDSINKYFLDVYRGNVNQDNLAYEMAMGAVLTQYHLGVTLNKKDANGNFKPIVVRASKDPKKPKRTIYIPDCL